MSSPQNFLRQVQRENELRAETEYFVPMFPKPQGTAAVRPRSTSPTFSVAALRDAGEQIHETRLCWEALERAGRNPQLHGVIQEMAFRDQMNLKNCFSGSWAVLTKSPTAIRDDVLMLRCGKVVGRWQVKDHVGAGQILRDVRAGKYAGTALVGAPETAKMFNAAAEKAGIARRMVATGISGNSTRRVAAKALGQMPATSCLIAGARSAALVGAGLEMGLTLATSAGDVWAGRMTGTDCAVKVVQEGTKAAVVSSASCVAGSVAATAGGALLTALSAPAWVPAACGLAAALGAGLGVRQLLDAIW